MNKLIAIMILVLTSSTYLNYGTPMSKNHYELSNRNIMNINVSPDLIVGANNFNNLYDDSDLIVNIKISECKSFFPYTDINVMSTKIVPEIIEVIKGKYNGEDIILPGGIVTYKEYLKHIAEGSYSKNNENDIDNKIEFVKSSFANAYVVKKGEEYILFCSKENNEFYSYSCNQGIFKVENNEIFNESIKNDHLGNDIGIKSEASVNKNTFIKRIKDRKMNTVF